MMISGILQNVIRPHHHLKIESAQRLIDVIAGFEYLKLWISSGFVQNDEVSQKLLSNSDF